MTRRILDCRRAQIERLCDKKGVRYVKTALFYMVFAFVLSVASALPSSAAVDLRAQPLEGG